MARRPIRNWIQFIPGYMQTQGQIDQGIPGMWHQFFQTFRRRACVQIHPWHTNWPDVAEQIFRASQNGELPRIMLVAYSWGVGYGAVRFLRELRDRGLHVEAGVFSDGVYHLGGPWCHRFGCSQVAAYVNRLSSRWPFYVRPKVRMPDNLSETHWFVQASSNFQLGDRKTWLRGHRLVWEHNGQELPGKVEVKGVRHSFMDEQPQFRERAMEVASRLFTRVES
jgi:hypothetical protein